MRAESHEDDWTVGSLFERATLRFEARTFSVQRDGEVAARRTYGETRARAHGIAARLVELGVESGERVALLEDNTAAFLECSFAVAHAGAVACPLNTRLAAAEIAAVLDDAECRAWIAGARFAPLVADVLPTVARSPHMLWIGLVPPDLPGEELEPAAASGRAVESARRAPSDLAQLYYTSGTTGRPKGVMLTHDNVCWHARGAIAELALDERDVWGHFAPLFHLADAWAALAITAVGGMHALLPRFDAAAALGAIARERVTLTNLIPTMLNRIARDPTAAEADTSSLRLVLSGGAPIAPELVRRVVDALGCAYAQTYGLTETSPYLTLALPRARDAFASPADELAFRARTGRPFADVELAVIGADGLPVPADDAHPGEVRARGRTVTQGYWKRPEETAAAFADGWLCTGDLATVDARGSLRIVDRAKDVIKSGGESVFSIEVENALLRHPAVLEVCVFGAPDEEWGEVVCAAVALTAGASASADELVDACRAQLARYKVPRRFRFLPELPRLGSGKVAKRQLAREEAERARDPAS